MTPEEAPEAEEAMAADILSAAARTIGHMPEDAIQLKFAQLQQAREARTEREIIRQQAEADSLEGDEAAFQAGLMYEKSDLKAAAHWYGAAAVNDFPGASLKLARVLTALAAEHHARGETQAEEALIADALEWCAKACAAGEFVEDESEAFDLMEELDARLDPDRPRSPAADRCVHGSLKGAAALNDVKFTEHLSSCSSCQAEQAERAARSASTPAPR